MAFTIETSWPFCSSASTTSRTYTFHAIGEVGTDDLEESYKAAMDAVESHVSTNYPMTPDGLVPESISDCETLGLRPVPRYKVDVNYTSAGAPVVYVQPSKNSVEYAFDLSVQSQHINYALEHIGQKMDAGKVSPVTTAISVDSQGVTQGTDILVPTAQFNLDYYAENSILTNAYLKIVEDMVGKVNNATFGHRAAGEVFLMGARGGKRTGEDWRIGFSFAVRENRPGATTPFTVNGIEIDFDVDGWELLDPIVEPEEGEDRVQSKIIGFNGLRIYETGNFALLALPGYV